MKVIETKFGWFDQGSTKPAHDPTTDCDCMSCGESLLNGDIKTISFMGMRSDRSYFYRIHKNCATEEEQQRIESLIIDSDNHINATRTEGDV